MKYICYENWKEELKMSDNQKTIISVCMGSSCFPRGNNRNLESLKIFIEKNRLEGIVDLIGNLCEGDCKKGTNMRIGEQPYHDVVPNSLKDI